MLIMVVNTGKGSVSTTIPEEITANKRQIQNMQSNIPPDKELNPEDKPEKTKETTDVDE